MAAAINDRRLSRRSVRVAFSVRQCPITNRFAIHAGCAFPFGISIVDLRFRCIVPAKWLGKSIGSYFRGIERGIADRAVPALVAAAGNDGTAKKSVELPPDKLAWFGAGGMAVHINDIHPLVVLFHLGLEPEILIAFGSGLIGKRTTRPIAIKPGCVSLFIAEAATDF